MITAAFARIVQNLFAAILNECQDTNHEFFFHMQIYKGFIVSKLQNILTNNFKIYAIAANIITICERPVFLYQGCFW